MHYRLYLLKPLVGVVQYKQNHIVDMCPFAKFEGGLNLLHEADDDAVIWQQYTVTAALAK